MANIDAELEQQLKEAGKQLSHPSDSNEELLSLLDQLEKLLSKVDQSPKKSMLDALKPSMKALVQESLLMHSNIDVKVAVASCVSEITRITAPDAPYDDDQMRDIFQLIVSSFEDIADQSSRSYIKRASILETVSKVRSCVIMLDLECDALIVEMFEHFLRSVRDYHHESIYPSMESIMVLVLEESEEISAEMLKPLLATVKRDSEGVLPVARKLAEGVLLKSADKLKPYLMPAIVSLGDTLDKYTKVVASVCEGKTATVEHNDEIASGTQPANESKLEKESVDEAQQADESKFTTASSEHMDQVVKGDSAEEVDPAIDRSPKSVMSNGVNVLGNEEASVDQEPPKKPEEDDTNQPSLNKEDTDDSDADKEPKPEEQTSKNRGQKADTVINSAEPSDSSHVEGEKEADKPPSEIEKDNDVKESEIGAVIPSEIEKDSDDVQVSSPKPVESKSASVSSPSQSNSRLDESCAKKAVQSKKQQVPQEDEIASPSKSETSPDETRTKKVGQPKKKGTQEDASEETGDLDIKPQKRTGKKEVVSKEVKPPPKDESEDDEAASDADAELQKQTVKKAVTAKEVKPSPKDESEDDEATSDSDAEPQKRTGKKAVVAKEVKPPPKGESEDDEATSESDAELQKQTGKKAAAAKDVKLPPKDDSEDDEATSESDAKPQKRTGKKAAAAKEVKLPPNDDSEDDEATSESDAKPQKRTGKKAAAAKEVKLPPKDESEDDEATSESDAPPLKKSVSKSTKQSDKKSKLSGKKTDAGESNAKKPKQTGKKVNVKVEDSDSEAKPLKLSVKKGQKSKPAAEEEEESDSENKPLKLSAKKGNSKKKDDGKKRGSGKNATENDQAKAMSSDDEMDYSPKSAAKSAKGEGSSKEIPTNSAKRKRSAVKDKVSDTIKYDKSLVGLKVKVWWPEDKMYYEGEIQSFDAAKKKHKVLYVDGEKETLNLKNEIWEILEEYSVRDEEQTIEAESEEASPETHKKKKSKTDVVPSASQDKIKDSAKRAGGASSSGKTKGSASKDNKSKDKSAAKPASQKTSGKSSDAVTSSSKPKKDEETPKAGTKTKQDTSKTVNKSKGKTPQTSSKSNSNGPTKAKSNVKEPEDVKTPDSPKGKSTGSTKGGSKKRKSRS